MPTVNERIFDMMVRHHVNIQQLSLSVLRKLLPILDQSDADIVDQLLKRTATLEGSFTSQRLQYLLTAIRDIARDANLELGNQLRQELRDAAKYESTFQAGMFQSVLPISFDVVSPTAGLLTSLVTNNPIQGRFLRDWLKDLTLGQQKRLTSAIQLGILQGEGVDDIVRRVRGTSALNYRDGVLSVNRRQAANLVRTAVNSVMSASREAFYDENSDLVDQVQWVATLDTATCEECAAYDGETFDINDGPRPPAHGSCRCATVPVVKSWRDLGIDADEMDPGTRASMDGQVADTVSFSDWLDNQSAAIQDESLGPTRGKLFRDGGLTIDRFTDTRGNILTLDELRQRDADAFERAGLAA